MVNVRRDLGGYTIIEVMIVLAVSATLFTTAIVGYGQQNRSTQFTNAVRELEQGIQDVLNDVGTGYYPSNSTFSCTRGVSGPVIDPASPKQLGTNQDCIFIGKAIDLNNLTTNSYDIYTIVGLTNKSSDADKLSANVVDAENRIIRGVSETTENRILNNALQLNRVIATGPAANDRGFAVISGFGATDKSGIGATTNQVAVSSVQQGYILDSSTGIVVDNTNLNQIITICLEENGGGRDAAIILGESGQFSIRTVIDEVVPGC